MEKRLYFCDICGDEIKEKERCRKFTIESVTVKKRVWDDARRDEFNKKLEEERKQIRECPIPVQ